MGSSSVDILKTATDWAKAEIFSSTFFVLFGIMFIVASIGFWQLGKTDIAKAYIIPTAVAGALLLIIGAGLIYANKTRITEFKTAYNSDAQAFVESEIARAKRTLDEYKHVVFTAIPIIIAACALVIIFVNTPIWRASMITTIAMMAVILLVDGTAHARIGIYNEKLIAVAKHEKSGEIEPVKITE